MIHSSPSPYVTPLTCTIVLVSIAKAKHLGNYSLEKHHPWTSAGFRVFGCPTYVLHKDVQDGSKRQKWTTRSWQGCYVGFSPMHARTVALIYNPATTHISPQFHLVYDEQFSSVSGHSNASTNNLMQSLFENSKWASEILHPDSSSAQYFFDDYWDTPNEPQSTDISSSAISGTKRDIHHILRPARTHGRSRCLSYYIHLRRTPEGDRKRHFYNVPRPRPSEGATKPARHDTITRRQCHSLPGTKSLSILRPIRLNHFACLETPS